MKRHEDSQLLALLNKRFKELGLDTVREYRTPQYSDPTLIPRALEAFANSSQVRSDPFALARMRLHLTRGIVDPHTVINDYARKQHLQQHLLESVSNG